MEMVHTRAEVEADMRETLGLVPTFFSRIPDELLSMSGRSSSAWSSARPSSPTSTRS